MRVLILVLISSSRDRDLAPLEEENGTFSQFHLYFLLFSYKFDFLFYINLLANQFEPSTSLSCLNHITSLMTYVLPTLLVSEALGM
jgi:hypothetical protein